LWGVDSWPQTCVQNSGKVKKLRERLSFEWIPDEDSWVHERIKEKAVFTRDSIECESAITSRDNIFARFSTTTLSGRYARIHLNVDNSGKPKFWFNMLTPG